MVVAVEFVQLQVHFEHIHDLMPQNRVSHCVTLKCISVYLMNYGTNQFCLEVASGCQ